MDPYKAINPIQNTQVLWLQLNSLYQDKYVLVYEVNTTGSDYILSDNQFSGVNMKSRIMAEDLNNKDICNLLGFPTSDFNGSWILKRECTIYK